MDLGTWVEDLETDKAAYFMRADNNNLGHRYVGEQKEIRKYFVACVFRYRGVIFFLAATGLAQLRSYILEDANSWQNRQQGLYQTEFT